MTLKNPIWTQHFCYSKNANKIIHKCKNQNILSGYYLLKVNNENSRTRCEICPKLTLLNMKTLKTLKLLCCLLWTLKNYTPFLSISLLNFGKCCRLGLSAEIKIQTSKYYETCKDRCKLCHQIVNQTHQTTTWKET